MIAQAKWKLTLNGHHRNPLRDALRKLDNRELYATYRRSLENNLKHPAHKAYSDFLWMLCVARGIITTKSISL